MEVVNIKKILVPNLLIYIYLYCVRSSLWCATMLATLTPIPSSCPHSYSMTPSATYINIIYIANMYMLTLELKIRFNLLSVYWNASMQPWIPGWNVLCPLSLDSWVKKSCRLFSWLNKQGTIFILCKQVLGHFLTHSLTVATNGLSCMKNTGAQIKVS